MRFEQGEQGKAGQTSSARRSERALRKAGGGQSLSTSAARVGGEKRELWPQMDQRPALPIRRARSVFGSAESQPSPTWLAAPSRFSSCQVRRTVHDAHRDKNM